MFFTIKLERGAGRATGPWPCLTVARSGHPPPTVARLPGCRLPCWPCRLAGWPCARLTVKPHERCPCVRSEWSPAWLGTCAPQYLGETRRQLRRAKRCGGSRATLLANKRGLDQSQTWNPKLQPQWRDLGRQPSTPRAFASLATRISPGRRRGLCSHSGCPLSQDVQAVTYDRFPSDKLLEAEGRNRGMRCRRYRSCKKAGAKTEARRIHGLTTHGQHGNIKLDSVDWHRKMLEACTFQPNGKWLLKKNLMRHEYPSMCQSVSWTTGMKRHGQQHIMKERTW